MAANATQLPTIYPQATHKESMLFPVPFPGPKALFPRIAPCRPALAFASPVSARTPFSNSAMLHKGAAKSRVLDCHSVEMEVMFPWNSILRITMGLI